MDNNRNVFDGQNYGTPTYGVPNYGVSNYAMPNYGLENINIQNYNYIPINISRIKLMPILLTSIEKSYFLIAITMLVMMINMGMKNNTLTPISIVSWLFTYGPITLFIYFHNLRKRIDSRKRVKKIIKQYGKKNIKNNIRTSTIFEVKNAFPSYMWLLDRKSVRSGKIYFTNEYIVHSGHTIIRYDDIVKIHTEIGKSYFASTRNIVCTLKDGTRQYLPIDIYDENILKYIKLCQMFNNNIVVGNY